MQTAVIIHGLPSKESYYNPEIEAQSNSHWLPWIQRQLLLKDILAQAPEMPTPYAPTYEGWKSIFEMFPLNEDTILIGHSCGGGFVLRYLSENDIKVGKVVLVAPWIDTDQTLISKMFDFTIDPNVADKTKELVIFNSKDDKENIQKSFNLIKERVKGARIVEFENMGHFIFKHMGTEAFPELLKEFE